MTTTTPRNKLIALCHVAKKELSLSDDSYRALLMGAAGKDSLRDMTDKELQTVIERFKKFGFNKKKSPKRAGEKRLADKGQAKVIRALWISLYQIGAVRDPSEEALASYAKRMSGVVSLQWLKPYQANVIINGLRDWLKREGVSRPDENASEIYRSLNPHGHEERAVVEAFEVILAQLKRLFGENYQEFLSNRGILSVYDLYRESPTALYIMIDELGDQIRRMKGLS